jgi:hypothetical protein
VDALVGIQKEIEKIRTTEVTERELDEAKQGVLNSFVFAFDSPAKTLSRVMRYEYFGYPKTFLFDYQKAIAAVTRADVLRVAREHFVPQNLAIVAVGNPKEFGKPLTTLGQVNTLDLTIKEPKQEKAKLEAASLAPGKPLTTLGQVTPLDLTIKEPKQETTQGDAASLAHGKELLQRAQQAMGGADKVAAIKDETESAEMSMGPAGGMKVKQLNRYILSGQMRTDQDTPIGKVIVYTDGATGWLVSPQGSGPLPPVVQRQILGEAFRNLPHIILADRDASMKVNATGPAAVEISGPGGLSAKLEFDSATGLPAKLTYRETSGGQPASIEQSYSDWRDAGGIKVPFKTTILQDGKEVGSAIVQDYKFNTGLKAEELSKKP